MKAYEDAKNKCINITAAFEGTGYTGITGSFDGMGWTYGLFGFNLGSGTLQKLIKAFYKADPKKFMELSTVYVEAYKKKTALGQVLLQLADMGSHEAVEWSKSRQDTKHVVSAHWKEVFANLGKYEPFRQAQRDFAVNQINKARGYCLKYKVFTERALALFFDCVIQQGGLTGTTINRIAARDLTKLSNIGKLEVIASCMSAQAREQYQADVLSRRLCIVRGKGTVHGKSYDLAEEFNLKDAVVVTP